MKIDGLILMHKFDLQGINKVGQPNFYNENFCILYRVKGYNNSFWLQIPKCAGMNYFLYPFNALWTWNSGKCRSLDFSREIMERLLPDFLLDKLVSMIKRKVQCRQLLICLFTTMKIIKQIETKYDLNMKSLFPR